MIFDATRDRLAISLRSTTGKGFQVPRRSRIAFEDDVNPSKTAIFTMLFANALFQGRPQIQSERGTTVVISETQDRIIIAADSRETLQSGGYRDNGCKISVFDNKTVFVSSGHRHMEVTLTGSPKQSPGVWDSHDVAARSLKTAVSKSSGNQGGVIAAAAHEWEKNADRYFSSIMRIDPTAALNLGEPVAGEISEGVFVGADSGGHIIAIEVVVKTNRAGPTIETSSQILGSQSFNVMGANSVPLEFYHRSSARAIAEIKKWQGTLIGKDATERAVLTVTQLVKWSVLYDTSGEVGGDVDTVVFDPSGPRWVYKKKYCKATE
jgi:hypothetical protein